MGWRTACLAAALLILLSAPLAAEAPRILLPESPLEDEPEDPVPAGPAAPEDDTGPETGIRTAPLPDLTIDDIGTLEPGTGGLPRDIWSGTSRTALRHLLDLIPGPSPFHVLNDLRQRLLLTAATAPPGDGGHSGALIRARADALFRGGDLARLSGFLDLLPIDYRDEALHQLATVTYFLAHDGSEASRRRGCAVTDLWLPQSQDSFWQKAQIYCDAIAGNWARVDYATRILLELGAQDDRFFMLTDAMQQQPAGNAELGPAPLSRLDGALITAGGLTLSDTDLLRLPDWMLTAYHHAAPPVSPESRLALAERAERAGLLSPADLISLYLELPAETVAADGAEARAETGSDALEGAALYRIMLSHVSPVARAQAIKHALGLALARGTFATAARLYARHVRAMSPDPALGWFAADAAVLLVAAGHDDLALPWLSLARQESAATPAAQADWHRAWPAIRLATGDSLVARDAERLDSWLDWARATDQDGARGRAPVILALMEAVGGPVPETVWLDLTEAPSHPASVAGLALTRALGAALRAGRKGEALALVLILAGSGDPDHRPPGDLVTAVSALAELGLETEARRLAFEIAVTLP